MEENPLKSINCLNMSSAQLIHVHLRVVYINILTRKTTATIIWQKITVTILSPKRSIMHKFTAQYQKKNSCVLVTGGIQDACFMYLFKWEKRICNFPSIQLWTFLKLTFKMFSWDRVFCKKLQLSKIFIVVIPF